MLRWLASIAVAIAAAAAVAAAAVTTSGIPRPHRTLIVHMEDLRAWSPLAFPDFFEAKLRRHGTDVFDVCHVARGAPLPPAVAGTYDAVVITGSHYDCLSERGDDVFDWFVPVMDLVRHAAENGHPRVFGSCFGANLMAVALGGVVSRLPNAKYVLQAETLTATPAFFTTMAPLADPADAATTAATASLLQPTYTVLSTHEHHCERLPAGAVVLGSTPHCPHHFFTLGPHGNLLGLQSHPEFELEYCVKDRIMPSVVDKLKRLSAAEVDESLRSFARYTPDDADRLCGVIDAFLRA
jgi:GMP synthase-like glutamine amidotransferase